MDGWKQRKSHLASSTEASRGPRRKATSFSLLTLFGAEMSLKTHLCPNCWFSTRFVSACFVHLIFHLHLSRTYSFGHQGALTLYRPRGEMFSVHATRPWKLREVFPSGSWWSVNGRFIFFISCIVTRVALVLSCSCCSEGRGLQTAQSWLRSHCQRTAE